MSAVSIHSVIYPSIWLSLTAFYAGCEFVTQKIECNFTAIWLGHDKNKNKNGKKETATLANNAINERNFQFAKQMSHKTEESMQRRFSESERERGRMMSGGKGERRGECYSSLLVSPMQCAGFLSPKCIRKSPGPCNNAVKYATCATRQMQQLAATYLWHLQHVRDIWAIACEIVFKCRCKWSNCVARGRRGKKRRSSSRTLCRVEGRRGKGGVAAAGEAWQMCI